LQLQYRASQVARALVKKRAIKVGSFKLIENTVPTAGAIYPHGSFKLIKNITPTAGAIYPHGSFKLIKNITPTAGAIYPHTFS
jgi:hypothetical protein